jgi:hypothetical protein
LSGLPLTAGSSPIDSLLKKNLNRRVQPVHEAGEPLSVRHDKLATDASITEVVFEAGTYFGGLRVRGPTDVSGSTETRCARTLPLHLRTLVRPTKFVMPWSSCMGKLPNETVEKLTLE